MIYEYWQHKSGELYAVRREDFGGVDAIAGPLDRSDLPPDPSDNNFESEDVAWAVAHWDDFTLWQPG